jgi:hypothetical protein
MDLATARAIVANPERAPHQADFALAGRVLADHWKQHPEQLKPARGVMTHDAKPKRETMADTLQSIRALGERINRMHRRHMLTRDQDLEGAQWTSGVMSQPTVGPRRIMQLPGPATAYSILTDADGNTWLVQSSNVEGVGGTDIQRPTGDRALDRHRAIKAQPDAGAAFAAKFNERQRAHLGR